ncbi:hypothetical protein WMQ10_24370 [Escherichia coli]
MLQVNGVRVFQHNLIATLAVNFIANDVQVKELHLFIAKTIGFTQGRGLLTVNARHLALQANHQTRNRHDRIFTHRNRIAPALQATGGRAHVRRVGHTLTGGTARFRKTNQQIGVTVATDLFLVHVRQQKIFRLGIAVRHTRIQVAQVVRERTHIVVVVFRPTRQVRTAQGATRPRQAKRAFVRAFTLDRILQRGTEFVTVHQRGHASHMAAARHQAAAVMMMMMAAAHGISPS